MDRQGQTRGSAVLRGRSAVSRFLLVSLVAACVASSLAAQATTATLQGTVTTSDGAVLPGAEVVAWSRESGSTPPGLTHVPGGFPLLRFAPGIFDRTPPAGGLPPPPPGGVAVLLRRRTAPH